MLEVILLTMFILFMVEVVVVVVVVVLMMVLLGVGMEVVWMVVVAVEGNGSSRP